MTRPAHIAARVALSATVLCLCRNVRGADNLPRPPDGFAWEIRSTWTNVKPDGSGRWPKPEIVDTSAFRDTTDGRKGTITANCDHFPGEDHANVFDDSDAKWCAKQAEICVDYAYPEGQRERVTAYTVTAANDHPERDPADWQLLGSTDGKAWTVIDERKGEDFPMRHIKRFFEIQQPGEFAAYRFQVLKNRGEEISQLEELELLVPAAPVKRLSRDEAIALLKTAESDEGFKPLFATDLSNAIAPKDVWTVEDGVLTASKDEAIWTKDDYANVLIDLEFKTADGTNSGVIVYCSNTGRWIPNSVEIQIADDHAKKWAESPKSWQCGAIFGHLPASKSVVKQPGEWNRYTILCAGKMIYVQLNGVLVNEMDMSKWTSAKKNPDGSDIPAWLSRPKAQLPTHGHIGLQGKHAGAPIYFRNLRIKPIE